MNHESLRTNLAGVVYKVLRRPAHALAVYGRRVGRWPIILWQVRGVQASDEIKLVLSALASPVVSLTDVSEWQDPLLLFDATVDVKGVGKFYLRRHCDDLWHVLPWRERQIFSEFRQVLRRGDTFVDAGANIGVYTVLAARLVGPEGTVLAVEMMPDTVRQLEANIRLNELGNVHVVRRALSDQPGQVVEAAVLPGKYGQASIGEHASARAGGTLVCVSTTTLDDVVQEVRSVRLMKMDLEGAELTALKGALAALSKTERLIYESWGRVREGANAVDDWLAMAGFEMRAIDNNNRLATRRR